MYYDGLGISLQIKCQYLESTVPGVDTLMGFIKKYLRETFLPTLFMVEEVDAKTFVKSQATVLSVIDWLYWTPEFYIECI